MCLLFCADVSIDGDNPDHISWIYERALERADEFGIQGVTYRLTQGTNRLSDILYAAHVTCLVSHSLVSQTCLKTGSSSLIPRLPSSGLQNTVIMNRRQGQSGIFSQVSMM